MPPHSPIFGHLLAIKDVLNIFPSGIHPVVPFGHISRQFPKSGFCYIDLWPFGVPFMIVTSPTMAIQATQQNELMLRRPEELKKWFKSITGGETLFDMSAGEANGRGGRSGLGLGLERAAAAGSIDKDC